MDQKALLEQVTRILLYILGPLLAKYGFDEGSTTMIVAGIGGLVVAVVWWLFFIKKNDVVPATK